MGLTTTKRGSTCRLGDDPDICAFPSICSDDEGDGSETKGKVLNPTAIFNFVTSCSPTSSGCARAYDSESDRDRDYHGF